MYAFFTLNKKYKLTIYAIKIKNIPVYDKKN